MPKIPDFTERVVPLFIIVMIGWVFYVISMLGTEGFRSFRNRNATLAFAIEAPPHVRGGDFPWPTHGIGQNPTCSIRPRTITGTDQWNGH